VALDVVLAPGVPTHPAASLLLGQALAPGRIRVVCPHVAVKVLSLGPPSAAEVAPAPLSVVVDMFAVRLGCLLASRRGLGGRAEGESLYALQVALAWIGLGAIRAREGVDSGSEVR
jgi:hypothetical protein